MRLTSLLAIFATLAYGQLDRALELQQQGRAGDALRILDREIPSLRASHDDARLAQALAAASETALSLGKYPVAAAHAREALTLHSKLNDRSAQALDWNTIGSSDLYSGNYTAALEDYEQALALDRSGGDAQGEIVRLNNIGGVYYFEGRYLDALRSYEAALAKVNATGGQSWNPRRRQLTIGNLAMLYQRLGADDRALKLYSEFRSGPNALPHGEQAQLLLNEGVLYRRLGDPVKALEMYAAAQSLYTRDHQRDGEIGALRNIGIVRGLDLQDLQGALRAFDAALELAREAGNVRGEVHAHLYRGEILRRLDRRTEAEAELRFALAKAQPARLVEEQWKALYSLGLLAQTEGDASRAQQSFEAAIRLIESVRGALQLTALKTDFLADKRDVYDALISLRLDAPQPSPEQLLSLMEQSRARVLQDRVSATGAGKPSIAAIQKQLGPGTLLVEYWLGSHSWAALWIDSSSAGVVKQAPAENIAAFNGALAAGSQDWRSMSSELGKRLLSGLPLHAGIQRIIVVPDGALETIPFEALEVPDRGRLMVEDFAVSYLPTAAFLGRGGSDKRTWRFPWQRQMEAVGDPVASSGAKPTGLPGNEQWERLPYSTEEVRAITAALRGQSEEHLGSDAQKKYLAGKRLEFVPILHLSTHASADMQDPERSRILLAPAGPGGAFDYLFLREIYSLDLKGVQLVTLSACDTERGKLVRGEGAQGFNRAFLAAGADSSVASLWRVADRPAAEFMKHFYYELSRGRAKSEALRTAKLAFLRSHSKLAHPRYWAAFVLSGDGRSPIAPVIPWGVLLGSFGVVVCIVAFLFRRRRVK